VRPDLQKVITRWLKGIQAKTFTGEDIERAGQALLNLADRQCDAGPVLDLAQEWARTDRIASAARLISETASSHRSAGPPGDGSTSASNCRTSTTGFTSWSPRSAPGTWR
jgi:hypothetical protein